MADSDDEYDKKFRDKFRGERDRADSAKGFDNRRDERRPPRDDWIERFVFETACHNSWSTICYANSNFFVGMLGLHVPEAEVISGIWWEKGTALFVMTLDPPWRECGMNGKYFFS